MPKNNKNNHEHNHELDNCGCEGETCNVDDNCNVGTCGCGCEEDLLEEKGTVMGQKTPYDHNYIRNIPLCSTLP